MIEETAFSYRFVTEPPSVAAHMALRHEAGMSTFSEQATSIALSGSIHAITVMRGDETVGMGRIIGDGGCFFQIVDIIVAKDHRGRGIGKGIMELLMQFAHDELPVDSFLSLLADVPADRLYAQFGFEKTAPVSIGMAIRTGNRPLAASPLNLRPTE